jgi:drug/metabolite transporter (DMT)-like permease
MNILAENSDKTRIKKGILLVLATAFISGFSIFISGLFAAKVGPSIFTFLKNGLTAFAVALLIFSIASIKKQPSEIKKLTPKNWFQLALIGLIGGAVPFILFFEGLVLTGSAQGALIHKTMFIFVLLLAILFLKEKPNSIIFPLAIILLIANYLLLNVNVNTVSNGHLMVLAATMLWAIENVISKHYLKNMAGNVLAFGRMFFGAIFIFLYLVLTNQHGALLTLNAEQWLLTIISTLFLIAYVTTWYNGLKHIPVTLATAILLLGAPITTLLNFIFLEKTISPLQIAGIILMALSVAAWIYITAKHHKTFKQPAPQHSHSAP